MRASILALLKDFSSFIGRFRRQGVSFLSTGDKRTVKAKKNIFVLGIMKGVGIASGLVLVPLTLSYLNPTEYGVWLTLSSIVGWIVYFDIGLGNGLRNKLAEALATADYQLARIYVSTTYFLVSLIAGILLLVFLSVNFFLDWQKILHAYAIPLRDLNLLVFIVIVFFCLRFVFSLIGTILTADQEPARAGMIEMAINLGSLAAVYGLTKTTQASLLSFGVVQSTITVLVLASSTVWLFSNRYKAVAPSIRLIRLKYARPLANIGVQFFILQIAYLVVFSTSSILIANLLGPADVTAYNIAYKYFGVVSMVFGITVAPFWSAFTEAFQKKETAWIQSSIRKLIAIWVLGAAGTAVMLLFSEPIYHLWVGNKVAVPFSLSLAMALFVTIGNWNSIFVSFLNGTGRIRIQLYNAVGVGVLNIPLAYCLVEYMNWGTAGVVGATSLCLFASSIWSPIQYRRLITNTATGIWAK